jgi:glutaminyl-peptide cyclotransferase
LENEITEQYIDNNKKIIAISLLGIAVLALVVGLTVFISKEDGGFDGQRAYRDVEYQMSLGPRTPGSTAHNQAAAWIATTLSAQGWQIENQRSEMMGHPINNIIARRGSGNPWIIIGAHYDSRMLADHDPDPTKRSLPVPGADDGASGVAVLTELGRTLPSNTPGQVWLVFFDAEDQGNIPGWDWILGSQVVADRLSGKPDAVVVLDMIGDENPQFYLESNSTPSLCKSIWAVADQSGYQDEFIPQNKYSMLDDHTPFLNKGISACDIIDFDYPYWHTTSDTVDKVSPKSLAIVGNVMLKWLGSH